MLTQGWNPETNQVVTLYEVKVTRGWSTTKLAVVITSSVVGGIIMIGLVVLIVIAKCLPKKKASSDKAIKEVNETSKKGE